MVEPYPVHLRRRPTLSAAIGSLTVLVLCASALPTGGAAAISSGAAPAVGTQQQARPSGGTVVEAIDVPSVRREAARSAKGGARVVASLPRTGTAAFSMLGVTWQTGTASADTDVQVAVRVDGTWSGFEELHVADEPGTGVGEDVRSGTEPLWVDEADGVAVRVVASGAPADLDVTTVQPDRADAALAAKTSSAPAAATITGAVPFPSRPDVMTRREWGADPDLGDTCWSPRFGRSARAVVVHHTVNSNDYSRTDGPAIVRSILAYHTQGQGWCDIGYNYLVDRFGQVYEGRAGGIRRPVRGAHAGDYNTDTVGISMIGDYDRARLPRALKNAMVRLVGWRLGTSYTRIYGKTRIYDRRVPHILGHRDVMSTACPGRYGYAFLPALRRRVATYLSEYDPAIKEYAGELGRDVTGRVFVGEIRHRRGYSTLFENGRMLLKRGLGAHWVSGRPLTVYRRQGGAGGNLGYPRTDLEPTGTPSVSRLLFEHGAMYQRGNGRPYVLHGRVRARWMNLGGLGGVMGAPVTSIASDAVRDTVKFQHGRITWNKRSNQVVVERA